MKQTNPLDGLVSSSDEIITNYDEALINSRKDDVESAVKTRTKLDEVVEAGLNIFGGRLIVD